MVPRIKFIRPETVQCCFGTFLFHSFPGQRKAKTLEIGELLVQAEGTEVKVNGAVHTIRDMGNVAFVILRKRDGLVQCVFEEGVTAFDLKELKEASAVEVLGTIRKEERAAHGIEIRLKEIKVLSEPD